MYNVNMRWYNRKDDLYAYNSRKNKSNFTMTELANQLNCSRQNLSNKMSRNNFDERELTAIANALGCELEINFVNRETGEKIEL